LRFAGVLTIEAQAATGVRVARASRHSLQQPRERISGYFTRLAE
jgi:hypothetical protein